MMLRWPLLFLLAGLLLSAGGCAWIADTIFESASRREYHDGRADDRQGLTRKDIVARGEEDAMRRWDARERTRERREDRERTAAFEENRALNDFLQRDRSKDMDFPTSHPDY
ncbi:MAG: hypothetical protein ACR2NP_00285 [Pirellulaceae bacterium]